MKENKLKLWCFCAVRSYDNSNSTTEHIKIDNKLVCVNCGRGN